MRSTCPLCGQASRRIGFAHVAPFIQELTGTPQSPVTSLRRCDQCDFAYYSFRFGPHVMSALYSGYRGHEYARVRRKWEPWYRSAMNNALDPGQPAVEERCAFMERVVGAEFSLHEMRNIVDFGGDAGQFLPPDYAGPKYLLEVSGRSHLQGVQMITRLDQVPMPGPQLVVCAHVLEHLPDPRAVLAEIRIALPSDGVLYIEVPLDRPKIRSWHAHHIYDHLSQALRRSRPSWIVADFVTGLHRNLDLTVPRLGVLKQSEHINYFSEGSLRRLLESSGFRVLHAVAEPSARIAGLRLGRLGVVARVGVRADN